MSFKSVLLSLVAPRGGSNVPAVVLSGDLNGGEVRSRVKSGSLGKSETKSFFKPQTCVTHVLAHIVNKYQQK